MKKTTTQNEEVKNKSPTRDLMEKYLVEEQENHILRCQSKHVLKLGNVVLEIIPTDKKQNLKETMQEFTKFAKVLQELHGDAHIKETIEEGNNTSALAALSGMYE